MDYDAKKEFYFKLEEYYTKQPAKRPFSEEEQATIIQEIQSAKLKSGQKTRRDYHLLSTYEVLSFENENFLIKKRRAGDTEIRYLVKYEELYDRCHEIHLSIGHGGRVKMRNASRIYAIPRPCIEAYLDVCRSCNKRRSKTDNSQKLQ